MISSYGWLVNNTIDDCLQSKLLKNIFKSKNRSSSCQRWSLHCFQSLVVIDSESCQTLFPSICAPPPEVALLFDSNLSRRPFLGQLTFHLRHIRLQTLVAIDSESCPTSFPRFCAPPFVVAVHFDSNHSRRPFLGQVVDLDLLLNTGFDLEHAVLFLCHMFTQRPMNDLL